jgi:hypothetical protein
MARHLHQLMTIDKVIQVDHQHLNTSKSNSNNGGDNGGQNYNYNQYTAYTSAQVKSGKQK